MSKVKITKGKATVVGEIVGIFQESEVLPPSPFVGGHPGGVVAYPVLLVKAYGELQKIRFLGIKVEYLEEEK